MTRIVAELMLLTKLSLTCRNCHQSIDNASFQSKPRPILEPNSILEQVHCSKLSLESALLALKKLDSKWTQRKAERWLRNRRNQNILPLEKKFRETFWRFVFYTVIYTFGCKTVFTKNWISDPKDLWNNYPFQEIDENVKRKFSV